MGLYFVKQTGAVEGFAPCRAFLVTVPFQTNSGLRYDVDASPKTNVERLVTITVKKVWNTDKPTATPSSVIVQLLRNGEVVETATLNKQNNWQVTYTGMPESDGYTIKEVNIPKGFTAIYNRKGYEFTVTNTASLAQTGQLIWPIPVLELELPARVDWSYEKLQKAPCHYYGSYYESDFVIAGHNYPSHFDRLSQLQAGDLVIFTDVTGQTHYYEVVLLETLFPTAIEEMITSGFDLSLYTCTPGGGNRVTIRCNSV